MRPSSHVYPHHSTLGNQGQALLGVKVQARAEPLHAHVCRTEHPHAGTCPTTLQPTCLSSEVATRCTAKRMCSGLFRAGRFKNRPREVRLSVQLFSPQFNPGIHALNISPSVIPVHSSPRRPARYRTFQDLRVRYRTAAPQAEQCSDETSATTHR